MWTRQDQTLPTDEESVADYLTRLTILLDQHNGIPVPPQQGDKTGAYETHQKQAFLKGLLPPLWADVGRL